MELMAKLLFLFVLLGVHSSVNSFIASGHGCKTDIECGQGRCDIDSRCRCYAGWKGARCIRHGEIAAGYDSHQCDHFVCSRHGSCESHFGAGCACEPGWKGLVCDISEGGASTTTEQPTTVEVTTVQTKSTTSIPPSTTRSATSIPPSTTRSATSIPPSTTRSATSTAILPTNTTSSNKSTTSLPLTSTATTVQGSTPTPLRAGVCAKFATVADISSYQISSHPEAVSCASGNNTSPEAFVLHHCNLTTPSVWKEGINIMTNCSAVPRYTPIASFGNHQYSSVGTLCGILVGCLSDGFQIAVQHCDQAPVIEHIITNNGLFVQDPTTYFTIVQ